MKKNIIILLSCILIAMTGTTQTTKLPPPRTTGGMPLMEALNKRQSSREFSEKKLPDQVLSDLLWAAWGYNRPDLKKRTAPSSMNKQEVVLYIAMQDGLFLYEAETHSLKKNLGDDVRALTGRQDFVANAPATLIFVADYNRMSDGADPVKDVTAHTDGAFISENVYLFCASENLATGIREWVDYDALGKAMKLPPNQHILFAQTVGYFK